MKFEQNIHKNHRHLSAKSASSKSSYTFNFNNSTHNINTLNKINIPKNQSLIDANDLNNRKHPTQLYNKNNIYYLTNEQTIGDEDIDIIEVESNDFNDDDEDREVGEDDDDDLEVTDEQEEADIKDLEDLLDDSDEKYYYTTIKVSFII